MIVALLSGYTWNKTGMVEICLARKQETQQYKNTYIEIHYVVESRLQLW